MKKFYILISSLEPTGLRELIYNLGGKCKVKSIGVFKQVEVFSISGSESDITEAKKRTTSLTMNYFVTDSSFV